ncbi:MAG: hypothetical protein AB7T74_15530 [Clostridia bacterium]
MELYTLRLGAPLSWAQVTTAFSLPHLTREGSEAVFIWTRDQLVTDSDEGPQLRRPVPQPLQSGTTREPAEAAADSSQIVLPAGSYLFCQGWLKDITSMEQTLEWFFREVWWTRAECRGPVYLRLIREDGKTAVQVMMET